MPLCSLAPPPAFFSDEELILDEIISADVDNITPMQALRLIERWRAGLLPGGGKKKNA